ncbi:MAG: acyltransferase [Ferruginibacter sp.]
MIFSKWFRKLAGKFYLYGKLEGERLLAVSVAKSYRSKATLGANTIIGRDGNIINNATDQSKIIIGCDCWIRGELLVYDTRGQITIGDHVFIGSGVKIWSSSKISIGNRVLISHDVNIHDNDSHPLHSGERHAHFKHIFNKDGLQDKSVINEAEIIIEDDVWIGFNATILKGVRIGKGAIVGSNTIITKDVPPLAIIVNQVNATIIKYSE